MVNVRPKRFRVPEGPFRLRRRYASGSNLKRAQKETVKFLCIVGIISALCQKYTVYSPSGRLASAWRVSASSASAHAKWYPIPVALGALVLVFFRYKRRMDSKEVLLDENGEEVVRLRGPWQVHVLGALPLRNLSRLWGYINELELPVWFRPYGIRLYAKAFGCNLDEIEIEDLTQYKSLGDFFYRKLKDGVRPIANAPLVSPADGTILHFGTIKDLQVEQVKGITYSLDALLGVETPTSPPSARIPFANADHETVLHREFADINGIEYSLSRLIGSNGNATQTPGDDASNTNARSFGETTDASVVNSKDFTQSVLDSVEVAAEMGARQSMDRRRSTSGTSVRPGNALFFSVIYLAPGDYHRFHSPTAWVVEKRRHFIGELFSVSPYIAKRLHNLFVLNERVALLGRWKYGFFSMVPVGATNVGSIKINFDTDLRTNERGRLPPAGTYSQAVYSAASPVLNGQPLRPAQEMGGFRLGSTIVLVFEAPKNFQFSVHAGQKVKVGEKLGDLVNVITRKDVEAMSGVLKGGEPVVVQA